MRSRGEKLGEAALKEWRAGLKARERNELSESSVGKREMIKRA